MRNFLRKIVSLLRPQRDAPGGASYLSTGERLDQRPAFEREMRTRTGGAGGA